MRMMLLSPYHVYVACSCNALSRLQCSLAAQNTLLKESGFYHLIWVEDIALHQLTPRHRPKKVHTQAHYEAKEGSQVCEPYLMFHCTFSYSYLVTTKRKSVLHKIYLGNCSGVGRHSSLLSPIQITQAHEWCTLATFMFAVAKLFLRLSVALFLLDLLRSNTKRRRILYFILAFTVTMNVASIALFLVQCHSNHQFWSIHPPSACFSPQHSKAIAICLDGRKDQTILSVMIKLMLQIVGSILCNSSIICLTIVILPDAEKVFQTRSGISFSSH